MLLSETDHSCWQRRWAWLLWNDSPSERIKRSLIFFDVESPIAAGVSGEIDGSELGMPLPSARSTCSTFSGEGKMFTTPTRLPSLRSPALPSTNALPSPIRALRRAIPDAPCIDTSAFPSRTRVPKMALLSHTGGPNARAPGWAAVVALDRHSRTELRQFRSKERILRRR